MGHAGRDAGTGDGDGGAGIDARRRQQRRAETAVEGEGGICLKIGAGVLDNAPNEGEAVRMHAAGGNRYGDIAGRHAGAIDESAAFDGADGEPGKVVTPDGIDAGHLRRLAADQRTAGQSTTGGHAFDDLDRFETFCKSH